MRTLLLLCLFTLITTTIFAQEDDLLSLIDDEEEEKVEYVTASFKTNRIINLSSLENTPAGVFDFKIGHRFGFINQGIYELFGLDNATIRLGADLGITDRLMVGFGRSSYQKTYDGYLKFKLLRQSTGAKKMPVTLSAFASVAINTLKSDDPDREEFFSSRMAYAFQLILGRKFNENLTLQVSPTLIHRNLVETADEKNDVIAFGFGGRYKVSRRVAINAEYIYVLPDQTLDVFTNSFSIGVDLETGGHVFQLHLTNSTAMIEKGFVAETVGDWFEGDIHFGFTISRVFTLWKPGRDK